MFFVTTSVLILGLAYVHVKGNDSDQFQMFRQAYINNHYPLQTNPIRRFCPRNICAELEHDGPTINVRCSTSSCTKRALQDDVGPFWANRGKKDPSYRREPLFVEEPRWVLRGGEDHNTPPFVNEFDPFFTSRGKKNKLNVDEENKDTIQAIFTKMRVRNRDFEANTKE